MRLTELQTDMLRALDSRPYRFQQLAEKYGMYGDADAVRANLEKLAYCEMVDVDPSDDSYSLSEAGVDYLLANPEVVKPRQLTNASTGNAKWTPPVMTPVRPDASRDLKSLSWSPDRTRKADDAVAA